jgi:hypothetical protein
VASLDSTVLIEPPFADSDELDAEAETAELRRRQRLREHSIQLRDDVKTQEQFYLIPEHVRRRWFYNSDFVQGLFDRVEDSAWYQKHRRRKHGGVAFVEPVHVEEEQQEAPVEETAAPKPAPQRDRSPEAKRRRKARSGRMAIALLLGLLGVVACLFLLRQSLRADTLCPQCGHHQEQVVWNIHSAVCEECSGNVGFACKCEECKHQFAFIPGLDTRTRFGAQMAPPCPECGSAKTVRVGR